MSFRTLQCIFSTPLALESGACRVIFMALPLFRSHVTGLDNLLQFLASFNRFTRLRKLRPVGVEH